MRTYLELLEWRKRVATLKAETIRLHVEENVSNSEIARRLGIRAWRTQSWLMLAGVFKRNKECGYNQVGILKRGVRKPEAKLRSAIVKSWRDEDNQARVAWNKIEWTWHLRFCQECGSLFTQRANGIFCTMICRTKSYLRENREVILSKAKSKSVAIAQAKAESNYAAQKPTCQFCQQPIPFLKFKRSPQAIYCSRRCGMKSNAAEYVSDPIKSANRKLIRRRCYQKRQDNGKNLAEKRAYYKNSPQARIAKNLRTRLYQAVKNGGGKKYGSTAQLTGADWPALSNWLQSKFQRGMNWNNYGLWHVDHEQPCAAFDLTKPEEQRKCFHYTNLQPMWSLDNIKKGGRIIPTQTSLLV